MKIIGMIPARLGSQRVARKNLRLLNGRPMISYIIEAALASGAMDEIYVNSEAPVIGEIAAQYGVRFYQRPEALSSNTTINDEFAYDFIEHVPGDVLVQLLPTSPLITPEEIRGFVNMMMDQKLDTLVSVVGHQIAAVYDGRPINFSAVEPHQSSQHMVPVQTYATVLMAWTYASFRKNMKDLGCAYHGGRGRTGYYPLKGLATIDIDHEEDFRLAEVALQSREGGGGGEPEYYRSRSETPVEAETDVPAILQKDGVLQNDFVHENLGRVNLEEIIRSQDNSRSWCRRLVNTENNSATLISQLPGEGNRLHFHPNWNEWWYIVAGEWIWEIEGKEYHVGKGDVVFIEKNKWHRITAAGHQPAVRLAVSKDKVPHVYKKKEHV